jgi:choline dehydrogenase-like flavoprotein
VIDTTTGKTTEYYAKIIFVNASTVATTAILLNSTSNRFPNGLGNGSDQLGRNLMDHHKGINATAEMDGMEDMYYYGRRPTPAYIARFRNVHKQDAPFLRGYHYGVSASRGRLGLEGIGAEAKEAACGLGGWRINMYAFGECLPYAENRVTLNHDKKDKWGRPLIAIDCECKDNEKKMNKDMGDTAGEMLEAAGYKNVQVSNAMSFPGNANHEMGTARMGKDPKTSVLNTFNQMHEVPNVFITDGSCMASGSCVNPSLTYMALTARACDYAVKELKKMNV